jgi:hypothetical protein
MRMKKNLKNILLFLIVSFTILNFVSAVEVNLNATADSNNQLVQFQLLKYEPYPVNPGEYFDLYISVQYVGNSGTYGSHFELVQNYPFSLDSNESAVRDFGILDSPAIVLHYKVKVDKDAVEGTNHIQLNYVVGPITYTKTFDIEVENSQTAFDAVIQQISGSTVSIALANTGKYAANSVIVKIPDQDSFTTTDNINGQMVGNLATGDYSVVSFSLASKMTRAMNLSSTSNIPNSGFQFQSVNASSNELKFEVDYTDNIGVRRTVNMELPLVLRATNSSSIVGAANYGNLPGNFPGRRTQSSWSVWYTILIIIAVLGIGLFIWFKKSPKKMKEFFGKIKNIFKRKKGSIDGASSVPDWVKNVKEKENESLHSSAKKNSREKERR